MSSPRTAVRSSPPRIGDCASWPIRSQKKTTGFYYLIEFEGEGDLVEKLETQYRRDERVIRFLTFRMDKYAVEYAEKRRNKNKSKQE